MDRGDGAPLRDAWRDDPSERPGGAGESRHVDDGGLRGASDHGGDTEGPPTASGAPDSASDHADNRSAPTRGDLRRMRHLAPVAAGISIVTMAALVAYATLRQDQDLLAAFRSLDWRAVPAALGLHVAAHWFWAMRYSLLARDFDADIGVPQAWRIVTAGVFGGAVTPGRVGGEGVKMAILMRGGLSGTRASRILLADRSVDLLFFLALGIVAAASMPTIFGVAAATTLPYALAGVALLVLFLVLLVWLLWRPGPIAAAAYTASSLFLRIWRRGPPTWRERFEKLVHDVRQGLIDLHRESPWRVATAYGLTAANWVAEYAVLWVLLWGFGFSVPFWQVFLVGVVITLVSNVPVTPGGAGIAEVAGLALLSPLAPGLTPAFVIAWRGLTYYYDLMVGGAMAGWMLPRRGRVTAGAGSAS